MVENAAAGTVVAILGAVDPDAGDSFIYTLTDSSGQFEIVGNEVRVKAGATLDFETAASYDLGIKVTDAAGLSYSETLTIAVTNQNETPIDITVAGGSVVENAAGGTVVATLGAIDPDAGDSFAYTLTDSSGKFEIVGNEVRVKAGATLDYETAASHDLGIAVTDAAGLSRSETLTIAVTNQNEAPSDITVAGGSVVENAVGGTVVATLGTVDPDAGDGFAYTLTDPSGKFEIVGNEVRVKAGATLDYETAASHDLGIAVTDAAGLSHSETLTIAVTNQNETPTDITVAGGSVVENAAGGTVVATLGTVDPDAGDSFTYTLTDPSGKFEIVGNEVRVKAGTTLDFETAASHDVGIAVTDAAGLSRSETVTIAVTNQNEAPSDITVAGGSVVENAAGGTVVATLGTVDPDAGDSFTYTLTDPSGKFEIVGNEVRVKAGATLDFETASSHDLDLTVTDAGGLSRSETLTIAVTNQSGSFTGTAANDVLTGSGEEDVLSGLAGNDTLRGFAGNDTLDGGAGNDTMIGGSGNDTYVVDAAGDVVTELAAEGTDTVQSSISYTLGANVENLSLTGAAAINATGNTLDNILTGNTGNNVLNGGAGNDTMIGGLGNDTYVVDAVGDIVTELAAQGTDTVQSSVSYTLGTNVENLSLTGAAAINATGNTLDNVLTGNSGNNILSGGAGNDTMIGGLGNDTYVVDAIGDVVTELAGQGTDTVQSSITYALGTDVENLLLTGTAAIDATGNALANTLTGNTGNNVLDGGLGNDTMIGGAGNDTYVVDAATDVVTELASQGTDTVLSSVTYTLGANVENLSLTGAAAINATGNTLNNVLTGNSGNNILSGGTGNDTMIGGLGNDTYVVDAAGDVVTELAGEGTDTVQSSITYALGADVENLLLTGTAAINATGNTLDNVLTGNTGNNVLSGGAGNDTLIGGTGNDTMIGGSGNDTYVVDAAGDVVTELAAEGTDTVQSSVSYTLGANVENLSLTGAAAINATGNTLDNVLTGNSGNNVLSGGAGNDTMIGGLGNDTYVVDAAGDVVTELAGQGTDTVQSSISYALGANVENLPLTGAAAINATGNALDNVLTGNTGNNVLNGGVGNDTLIGGDGNDVFVYMHGHGSDVVHGGTGANWLDTIDLDQSLGSLQPTSDWTISLTSGSIVSSGANDMVFSNDASGVINFADGSKIDFVEIERVHW